MQKTDLLVYIRLYLMYFSIQIISECLEKRFIKWPEKKNTN